MVCLRREGITAKQQLFVYTVVDEKGDVHIAGKLKKKPAGSASQNPPGRLLIRNSKELFIE
jgi:hypothetical protein